jgi:hypothetical protein
MLIWLFHNRSIITAGITGGLAILALALLLMAPRAAFAAWPVDIVAGWDAEGVAAGGIAPISGYPDMPEKLDAGTRYFEIANRCDFILLERMEGQTVNRVEYRDLAFSLHTTSGDKNWGFYLSYEGLNGNAYFLSDGLVDAFNISPKQWTLGVCKRINPDWLLACVAKREHGAAPASIDSLVTNLSRFDPGDSTGSVRSSIDGFEAQIRNENAEGEAFTLSLGYDDLSAAMRITSPDESLDIALPLSGWHFATGYEKDTGEKAFKTRFEWSSLGGVGRIMFNDELDLGPVHNGYMNTELAFTWRIGREDDDADYFGLKLNRNRLASYGSADAVVFGGPIFGIISGRGHYDGAVKFDNLAAHYAHRWRVGDSTGISTG